MISNNAAGTAILLPAKWVCSKMKRVLLMNKTNKKSRHDVSLFGSTILLIWFHYPLIFLKIQDNFPLLFLLKR